MVSREELNETEAYIILEKYKDEINESAKTDNMMAYIKEQLYCDINDYIKRINRELKDIMTKLLLYRFAPDVYQTYEPFIMDVKSITFLDFPYEIYGFKTVDEYVKFINHLYDLIDRPDMYITSDDYYFNIVTLDGFLNWLLPEDGFDKTDYSIENLISMEFVDTYMKKYAVTDCMKSFDYNK